MYIISMKTMTEAVKSKRILNRMAVDCEVVSLDANLTRGGCAYGIRVYGPINEVIAALEGGSVSYGQIIGG